MNEVVKAIKERYSCRDFKNTPLTEEQVKMLVESALAAPSAMNRQPWHIIMITDKAFIDEMDADGMNTLASAEDKAGYERMKARGGKLFYGAPCMMMVASDGSPYASMDSGILTENVCLAAHSLGLATCIVGMAGVPLNGPRGDEFKKRMSFPADHVFGIGILIGAPESGKEPHELDMGRVSYVK